MVKELSFGNQAEKEGSLPFWRESLAKYSRFPTLEEEFLFRQKVSEKNRWEYCLPKSRLRE